MADFKWNVDFGHMTVRNADGQLLESFDVDEYPEDIQKHIADFGFKSLFQARASQVAQADKLDYWRALDAQFKEGRWASERQAGAPTVAPWVEALADVRDVSVAAIQKALAGYDKETRAKIRATVETQHADVIESILEAKAEATVNLDDLV